MTGMQNMKHYANMRHNITQERINEVVELVGLTNRINEKVKKYSLGMRQRLGVAQALLHNPKVLILDEPTNGLDPAGIKQLRDILKDISHKESVCVLVSSHLMSEMEMMCDRVGIVTQGKLIDVKTVEDMIKALDKNTVNYIYQVKDSNSVANLINDKYPDFTIVIMNDKQFNIDLPIENSEHYISEINTYIIENNFCLYTVAKKEKHNLEDAFIELTNKGGTQIV